MLRMTRVAQTTCCLALRSNKRTRESANWRVLSAIGGRVVPDPLVPPAHGQSLTRLSVPPKNPTQESPTESPPTIHDGMRSMPYAGGSDNLLSRFAQQQEDLRKRQLAGFARHRWPRCP